MVQYCNTLAIVLVLTLCSQVSTQYMMLDGIFFIYLNSLFGKTGSFISNFAFSEILGLRLKCTHQRCEDTCAGGELAGDAGQGCGVPNFGARF